MRESDKMTAYSTVDLAHVNLKKSFFVSCISIATFTIAFTFFVLSVIRFPSPPFEKIILSEYVNK